MIERLKQIPGMTLYPRSVRRVEGSTFFLAREVQKKFLGIMGNQKDFEGQMRGEILMCPLTANNAAVIRNRIPQLHPQPLGLSQSFGFGDRLGLATPGHILALQKSRAIAPIFAQQSMRENARTGRTPQEVLDDAMWGVFQEGWREPWGADADHLNHPDDIDHCVTAGYSFFTFDPGEFVDNTVEHDSLKTIQEKFRSLPWDIFKRSPREMEEAYVGQTVNLGSGFSMTFDLQTLLRAGCKYGHAIGQVVRMYRHLTRLTKNFELEISVDETETPTTIEEHYFIAAELKRLGVNWISLAPRYAGRFEKGVEYIGDLNKFEDDLKFHAAIARKIGPYKLSLHSGSDKFSIYPIFSNHTNGIAHLKTAGTSYLEALRVIAKLNPGLFRAIYSLAIERYPQDRSTYHVSADLSHAPKIDQFKVDELPRVLDDFHAREILHVTYGSALAQLKDKILASLSENESDYLRVLQEHFVKHLQSFTQGE
ncbi:MAG: hypothetical protein A2Z14_18480 [Chloroflexi bacterium RBG_16_48_8]|nr:MAG: hypothetical protein A2Z14_18480 [Chloroflexi bacterium RBG_16_48_8]